MDRMLKNEVIDLLQDLEILYPGKFKIESTRIVELWHNALADQDAAIIKRNLSRYVKGNSWPPGISDLMEFDHSGPAIPNAEQTKARMLAEEKRIAEVRAEREKNGDAEIEAAKAKIREILGIAGNGK